MDPENNTDFDKLKEAILKKYDINAETYRSQFRALDTSQDETQELYIRLKDLFCKWVKYDSCSKKALMETMVLEQYLRTLYPEVRTWVKERNPATAAEAATTVENFVAAHKGSKRYRYAGVWDHPPWERKMEDPSVPYRDLGCPQARGFRLSHLLLWSVLLLHLYNALHNFFNGVLRQRRGHGGCCYWHSICTQR
ncbi:hypothetical protein D4764_09G0004620 [Takifugu flavidus]|uniref:SCAN box domain-containing protein n=1 Tax=Takifugu flavidus TaxID=433684 RepID=A0A5C6MKP0_9TELE|nr:hypothetical protein D4764_09G0004620 [Takifugu flavidus]